MHVGVVAYELEGERTGVGRYLAGLLGGVAEVGPGWRWTLFFYGGRYEEPLLGADGFEGVFAGRASIGWGGRAWLWEQTRLPAELGRRGVELVFSPSYSLPPRLPAPGVVTIHDLSFERLPEDLGWRERWRRRVLARLACRRAARVLADREGIKAELVERYGLAPGDVGVVPLGVDAGLIAAGGPDPENGPLASPDWGIRLPDEPGHERPPDDPASDIGEGTAPLVTEVERAAASAGGGSGSVAGAGSLPADRRVLAGLGVTPPYLLHLGALFERRRPELLLEAFARLRDRFPDLSLVLAGPDRLRRPGGIERLLADPRLGGGVVRLGWVPEAAVGPLYRGAELTVYLSEYEGFGLPPLESLAAGTPAVVTPGQALDDLWPGYPYRCAGLEPEEVARTIAAALADPAGRAAVAAEGRRRATGWSWRRAAEVFLAELELAARR